MGSEAQPPQCSDPCSDLQGRVCLAKFWNQGFAEGFACWRCSCCGFVKSEQSSCGQEEFVGVS